MGLGSRFGTYPRLLIILNESSTDFIVNTRSGVLFSLSIKWVPENSSWRSWMLITGERLTLVETNVLNRLKYLHQNGFSLAFMELSITTIVVYLTSDNI